MGIVRAQIASSLDGYTSGPNQPLEQPFGDNADHLHDWMLNLRSSKAPPLIDGWLPASDLHDEHST
jgi:hypothetical protein